MPDETTPGQEPNGGQEPTAPTGQEPTEDQPQTFDAEYVTQLRQEAAKWRKELRELQKKQEALEAEKQQQEEERLKQQQEFQKLAEKRAERIAELEIQMEESELRFQEWRNERAILEAAHGLGIEPKLARRIIDYAELQHDDDGNPTNAKELLEAAVEEFGLKAEAPSKQGIPPTPRARGDGKLTEEEKLKRAYFPRI